MSSRKIHTHVELFQSMDSNLRINCTDADMQGCSSSLSPQRHTVEELFPRQEWEKPVPWVMKQFLLDEGESLVIRRHDLRPWPQSPCCTAEDSDVLTSQPSPSTPHPGALVLSSLLITLEIVVCECGGCACHGACVNIRRQPWGAGSCLLPLCETQRLNAGGQAFVASALSTEPSCQPRSHDSYQYWMSSST